MADKIAASIDIADLDTAKASDKGAEIELVHPTTQKPLGIFFNILGKDSEVFRDHVKNEVNSRIRREAIASRRNKQVDPPTAEEAEDKAIELLVICTLGWRSSDGDTITMGGEKLVFNVANAKRVYSESLWIRRQIDEAIGDLENFM